VKISSCGSETVDSFSSLPPPGELHSSGSPGIPEWRPLALGYTRAENPHSNLFNKQGLPASAFRYRALARQHSAKIADLIETKVFVFGADKVTE
jgi:hypothetical protein